MTYSTLVFISLVALGLSNSICLDPMCDITPIKQTIVGCGCATQDCVINCNSVEECGEISVYTSAKVTDINCANEDNCKSIKVYANPIESIIPAELSELVFDDALLCAGQEVVNFVCSGKSSCGDSTTIINDAKLTLTASDSDSLDESNVTCSASSTCNIVCTKRDSCPQSIFNGASCDGVGCPGVTTAAATTAAPIVPTTTVEQTTTEALPDYRRCGAEDITIVDNKRVCTINGERQQKIVVTTADDIDELKILCLTSGQCKFDNSAFEVYSGANVTTIKCGDMGTEEACKEALFYAGELKGDFVPRGFTEDDFRGSKTSYSLTCYGQGSCKGVNVTVKGDVKFGGSIMAMDIDSYEQGCINCKLSIGQECLITCDAKMQDSCGEVFSKGDARIVYVGTTTTVADTTVAPVISVPAASRIAQRQANNNVDQRDIDPIPVSSRAPNNAIGARGETIIRDATYDECLIDCRLEDQCTKLNTNQFVVYSGCNITTIECGESSCYGGKFLIGAIPQSELPDGLEAADFAGKKKAVFIYCNDYKSCKNANIQIYGDYQYEPQIAATMDDGLNGATVTCEPGNCVFECGDIEEASCTDTNIDCGIDGNCICNGGSCNRGNGDFIGVQKVTSSPTIPTTSPTDQPTKFPTLSPTTSPTSSNRLEFEPKRNDIIICKNNVGQCVIDCTLDRPEQCKSITVLSAANETEIRCNNQDACKESAIYIGKLPQELPGQLVRRFRRVNPDDFILDNGKSVVIDCAASAACKDSIIHIDATLSAGARIFAEDEDDAVCKANIDVSLIGGVCELNCGELNGYQACKDVSVTGCNCIGSADACGLLRQSVNEISTVPNSNVVNSNNHYPSFLPISIIVCISFGLICLVSYFIYYKWFTNAEKRVLLNDDDDYNTFNKNNHESLEMNQFKNIM